MDGGLLKRRALATAVLLMLSLPALWGPGGSMRTRASAAPEPAELPPNVLIIMTDDQRSGGGTMEVMPETVRRIGGKGMTFPNAFATIPVCCPSRASIMTGQYAHNHGVVDNHSAFELDADETLQAALDRAGYHTSIFGKYLNNWMGDPPHFDRWITFSEDPTRTAVTRYNDQGTFVAKDGYPTDVLRSAAVDRLKSNERRDKRPWLMYITPQAPHWPYVPAPRHRGDPVDEWPGNPAVFELDRTDKPDYVQRRSDTLEEAQEVRRKQLRSLMAVDEMVARLDRLMRRLDERRNTIVIFMSDNGYAWSDHGLLGPTFSKNTPYTPSVKIPLLMRWPAELEGKRSRRLVTTVDIAPTIYDAAGIRPPARVDGRSLVDNSWKRQTVFLEHYANGSQEIIPKWLSLRTRDYQYVEYFDDQDEISFREYYDLDVDPWQLENLFEDLDPLNDPDVSDEHAYVTRLSTCRGTDGANPCP